MSLGEMGIATQLDAESSLKEVGLHDDNNQRNTRDIFKKMLGEGKITRTHVERVK
jgi:hypothetical protein